MKKTFFLLSLTTIITLTAVYKVVAQPSSTNPLPDIQDPLLQKAWSLLNQRTDLVQLWNGQVLSGHELAQFVLVHAVPIQWDVDHKYGSGSCSLRCAGGNSCSQTDGVTSAHPIYIDPLLMPKNDGQMTALIDALAHEIYHYTLPYGAVDDTLYEEFSAYYVGEHIANNLLVKFDGYDPLRPVCLVKWFYDTQTLQTYQHLKAYPQAVLPSVDTSSTTCLPPADSSVSAAQGSPLTCTLNADGTPNCVFPVASTPAPEYRVECQDYPDGLYGCKTIWLTPEPTTQATPEAPNK